MNLQDNMIIVNFQDTSVVNQVVFIHNLANPCGLDPCKNGAKCFNDGEKFRCVCTAGFMGLTCVERK